MSDYPLDPLHAKIVLAASTQFNCVSEALTIVAMLNVPNIYIRPRNQTELADSKKSQFTNKDGDHLSILNTFTAFK